MYVASHHTTREPELYVDPQSHKMTRLVVERAKHHSSPDRSNPITVIEICSKYGLRCLDYLPEFGTQSAHLIDSASAGAEQVRINEIARQSDTNHTMFFSFLLD